MIIQKQIMWYRILIYVEKYKGGHLTYNLYLELQLHNQPKFEKETIKLVEANIGNIFVIL